MLTQENSMNLYDPRDQSATAAAQIAARAEWFTDGGGFDFLASESGTSGAPSLHDSTFVTCQAGRAFLTWQSLRTSRATRRCG